MKVSLFIGRTFPLLLVNSSEIFVFYTVDVFRALLINRENEQISDYVQLDLKSKNTVSLPKVSRRIVIS